MSRLGLICLAALGTLIGLPRLADRFRVESGRPAERTSRPQRADAASPHGGADKITPSDLSFNATAGLGLTAKSSHHLILAQSGKEPMIPIAAVSGTPSLPGPQGAIGTSAQGTLKTPPPKPLKISKAREEDAVKNRVSAKRMTRSVRRARKSRRRVRAQENDSWF